MTVQPGEPISFAVSTTADAFDARLVKLHHRSDLFEPIDASLNGRHPGRLQPIQTGSYAVLARPGLEWPADLSVSLYFSPTIDAGGPRQGILTNGPRHGLFVEDGRLLAIGGGDELRCDIRLERNQWYRIDLTASGGSGGRLEVVPLDDRQPGATVESLEPFDAVCPAHFRLSGWEEQGVTRGCVDGKIARPVIRSLAGDMIAQWDMGRHHATTQVEGVGGTGSDLVLHQHPRRAVTGPGWDGSVQNPQLAPDHYDAIAFHGDDLTDAGWETSLNWIVPNDLPSGAYAVELSTGEARDHLPFFVTAPGGKRARIAFLAPTFSYLAYANERHWWQMFDVETRTGKPVEQAVTPAELWASEKGLLSAYDRHRDETGCAHSSWLRPIVNLRADYHHPYVGGPHQLSADMLILDWLENIGERFDIVTDHDVHHRGLDALDGYAVVMTGSHPEYVSGAMLDALDAFNRQGGALMYLGGNGFYSAVSTYPDEPHVMELRRGHSGGAHWKSPAGEGHHASTGEPGGKWKIRDRSSHRLFGVGTSSVTFGRGSPYHRTDASRDPAFAWVFDGVDGDIIDTESSILGQPAGFEYDRMDHRLGTPSATVCLASAWFQPAMTEYLTDDWRWTARLGENRSDMVLIPGHGRRGEIFAVGSIAWAGCLLTDGGRNKVATITRNVLQRFDRRSGSDG